MATRYYFIRRTNKAGTTRAAFKGSSPKAAMQMMGVDCSKHKQFKPCADYATSEAGTVVSAWPITRSEYLGWDYKLVAEKPATAAKLSSDAVVEKVTAPSVPSLVEKLYGQACAHVDELKARGWTRDDFAHALRKLLYVVSVPPVSKKHRSRALFGVVATA